jgi:ABC-type amino acid transport substrate-binding protein
MKTLLILSFAVASICMRSQTDSLVIHYFENYPYSFNENGTVKGIEVDIMNEYVKWLKAKKNINVTPVYRPYKEFNAFYNSVKDGHKNIIGLGSVTNVTARENEVNFSAPYLQNVAVMITSGTVQTMKSAEAGDAKPIIEKLSAYVVRGSSHSTYIDLIKKKYSPNLKVNYTENQEQVLENIASHPMTFGYVDIVAYWAFIKKNQNKFLKIQKAFSEPKDFMSFITPKNGSQISNINEFLESGFGFTSTKIYNEILERYLGHEIINSVEIK